MQSKEPATTARRDKPRIVQRHLPICTFAGCDQKFETTLTASKALIAATDHAVKAGHVYAKPVKVERTRAIVSERIVD